MVSEVLAGLVDGVTFHSPGNGLCVLRVKTRGQRDLITAIRLVPEPRNGSEIAWPGRLLLAIGRRMHSAGFWVPCPQLCSRCGLPTRRCGQIFEPSMSEEELDALQHSADILKAALARVKF